MSSFCICKSYSHFFSKNTCELIIVLTRTVNILTTNELVKLTMLWTTGPWCLGYYHIYHKYWDTLSTYHTCSNSPFYYLLVYLKYCCMYGKQCRPWSDAAECVFWSGSTLFAKAYLSQYFGLLQYLIGADCNIFSQVHFALYRKLS